MYLSQTQQELRPLPCEQPGFSELRWVEFTCPLIIMEMENEPIAYFFLTGRTTYL